MAEPVGVGDGGLVEVARGAENQGLLFSALTVGMADSYRGLWLNFNAAPAAAAPAGP